MNNRLPYYMTYQNSFMYGAMQDEGRMSRRDYDYMKSMYPATAKRLLPFIEEECDRLEYAGSMMYDEYPDRLQLRLICRRIYERASEGEENPGSWLSDLIEVLAYQELLKRRNEYRSFRGISGRELF